MVSPTMLGEIESRFKQVNKSSIREEHEMHCQHQQTWWLVFPNPKASWWKQKRHNIWETWVHLSIKYAYEIIFKLHKSLPHQFLVLLGTIVVIKVISSGDLVSIIFLDSDL